MGEFSKMLGLGGGGSPSTDYMGAAEYFKKRGIKPNFFDNFDFSSDKVDATPSSFLGGLAFADEFKSFDPALNDYMSVIKDSPGEYTGGMDFANEYAVSGAGPDLSYEPSELPGTEPNAPSESPRFSDYLKKYGAMAAEALDAAGSAETPDDIEFESGRLMAPSAYGGPRGGSGFRGVGDPRYKNVYSAENYQRLMEDRLKMLLAEYIRKSQINPLV